MFTILTLFLLSTKTLPQSCCTTAFKEHLMSSFIPEMEKRISNVVVVIYKTDFSASDNKLSMKYIRGGYEITTFHICGTQFVSNCLT